MADYARVSLLTAKFQALRCTISRGGFSDERVFAIQVDELPHIGVGSRRHFWTLAGDPLDDGEPPLDQKIEGLVAATVVKINLGKVLVSIPDGEVITVPPEALLDRPLAAKRGPHALVPAQWSHMPLTTISVVSPRWSSAACVQRLIMGGTSKRGDWE